MNEEELVSYVVRYCKHELSEEEYRFLQRWLEEKQENRQTFREWVRTYRQGRKVGCWDGIQEEQAWEQISCRLSASPRKRRRLWKEWWKQVAILILLLGSGLLYYSLQQLQESRETALSQIVPGSRKAVLRLSDGREVTLEKETTCVLTEEDGTRISVGGQEHIVYQAVSQEQEKLAYNTITVPRGGEYSLVLSDGTRVWLNAATELKYPVAFHAKERRVYLKGEAYFEVAPDKNRPFYVETEEVKIRVLGTVFDVNTHYTRGVRTVLVEGAVALEWGDQKEIRMKPGELADFDRTTTEVTLKEVDVTSYISWKEGYFVFEDEPLEEIMHTLSLWYDKEFLFVGKRSRTLHFSGHIKRYERIETILSAITDVTGVEFRMNGQIILIR